MATRIVVIGTGTGIGKTHASVALLTALARKGLAASGLKPVESGVGLGDSDADILARASSVQPQPSAYAFPDPVSPHLAARRAHTSIALDVICAWVAGHRADWLIVETAGGLLSPLGADLTNLDLARALSPQALFLVAADRLGVLHDVHACMLALKTLLPGFTRIGCLLQEPALADSSTGTNASELMGLGIISAVTSFPRAEPTAAASVAAAEQALELVAVT